MRYLQHIFILSFCIIAFSACEDKDDDDIINPADNNFFVEFVLGADTIRYQDNVNDYGNGPGRDTYVDQFGRLIRQFSTFGRNTVAPDTLKSALSIQVVKFFSDSSAPAYLAEFQIFDSANLAYGSYSADSSNLGINGAIIAYTDANGKIWSSDRKFGTQPSGVSFAITAHQAVDEALFGGETRGTFNCTVFDGLGNALELRNGRFFARTILK